MNDNILQGKWKQMRGSVKEWWGKLTDSDLDRVGGKLENLSGVLQEKYGYTREQADAEIAKRMQEHDQKNVPETHKV